MKRIASLALIGWAGIAWLAWHLADQRIRICGSYDPACTIKATAARDATLTNGLTVGLAICVGFALLAAATFSRLPRDGVDHGPASSRPLRLSTMSYLHGAIQRGRGVNWLRVGIFALGMFGLGWLISATFAEFRGAKAAPPYSAEEYALASDAAAPYGDPVYVSAPGAAPQAGSATEHDTADNAIAQDAAEEDGPGE